MDLDDLLEEFKDDQIRGQFQGLDSSWADHSIIEV